MKLIRRATIGVVFSALALTTLGIGEAIAQPRHSLRQDLYRRSSNRVSRDFDRDGIRNSRDRDDDNDGIPDRRDRNDRSYRGGVRSRTYGWRGTSGNRYGTYGGRTSTSWRYDLDRDGIPDRQDRDVDGDGRRNGDDDYPRNPRRR